MFDFIAMRDRLAEFPTAEMLIGLCLLALLAFIADFVVRRILTRLILRVVGRAVHDLILVYLKKAGSAVEKTKTVVLDAGQSSLVRLSTEAGLKLPLASG